MSSEYFDFEASRRYWRLAPSGAGKHDTSNLAAAAEAAVLQEWREGFSKRFSNYVEEDQFLGVMGREFSGQKILSIGSGLGFHEMYYASKGACITCCDIVPTNLAVIDRVSSALGYTISTQLLSDDTEFGGPFDTVFIYGSLMTMPQDAQKRLLKRLAAALAPNGHILLMLYTWEFARATCGWTHPDEFDPLVFARASDPSVGEEHCPWSDWHDDTRLMAVAPSEFKINRRQFWQDGWFVWYELNRSSHEAEKVELFFDPADLEGKLVSAIALETFQPAAATVALDGGILEIETEVNCASYAAVSNAFGGNAANVLVVDFELKQGAFSVGLLDELAGTFIASSPARKSSCGKLLIALPPLPEKIRVILSNFRDEPAASSVDIFRVSLGLRESASQDFLSSHNSSVA